MQDVSYLVATMVKRYIQTSEMDIILGFLRRLPRKTVYTIQYTKNDKASCIHYIRK